MTWEPAWTDPVSGTALDHYDPPLRLHPSRGDKPRWWPRRAYCWAYGDGHEAPARPFVTSRWALWLVRWAAPRILPMWGHPVTFYGKRPPPRSLP